MRVFSANSKKPSKPATTLRRVAKKASKQLGDKSETKEAGGLFVEEFVELNPRATRGSGAAPAPLYAEGATGVGPEL